MNRDLNTYLAIIDGVRESSYPSKIAERLKISKQNLNFYVKELKKQNILIKIGASWRVNEKEVRNFIENLLPSKEDSAGNSKFYKENTIRGHNFMFTLISSKIPNQDIRRKIFDREKISYWDTGSGTWSGDKIELNGWTVRINDNVIMCNFKKLRSIYGDDAVSIFLDATLKWKEQVIYKLESYFGISLKTKMKNDEPAYNFKSSNAKHYALVNNSHAKILANEKQKLYVRSEDGTLWLLADFSNNVHEMEVVGEPNKNNQEDATNFMKKYYNDVEKSRITMTDVLNMFAETSKIQMHNATQINDFSEKSKEYAENIKTHIKAVKQLGDGIKKLTKAVKDISKKPKYNRTQTNLKRFL